MQAPLFRLYPAVKDGVSDGRDKVLSDGAVLTVREERGFLARPYHTTYLTASMEGDMEASIIYWKWDDSHIVTEKYISQIDDIVNRSIFHIYTLQRIGAIKERLPMKCFMRLKRQPDIST